MPYKVLFEEYKRIYIYDYFTAFEVPSQVSLYRSYYFPISYTKQQLVGHMTLRILNINLGINSITLVLDS